MNYGAEPADQVVRYTLEGTEFALKISGTAAKNFAVFALAVLRDQKKTHGKTKLVRLLREGKPLKFFSVPTDQMRDFAKAAKSHGLLYVPIRDRSDPDNIEIAVWAEDAAKVKYPDLHSYIQAEVIPTMQKKLRQGFGRAIRTETDTCTVAILDPRAAPGGRYHRAALDALPKMNMTQDIKDVEHFIRAVKGAEYFFA